MNDKSYLKTTTIRLDATMLGRLDEASRLQQTSRAHLIRTTLERALTHWETNERKLFLLDLLRRDDLQRPATNSDATVGRSSISVKTAQEMK